MAAKVRLRYVSGKFCRHSLPQSGSAKAWFGALHAWSIWSEPLRLRPEDSGEDGFITTHTYIYIYIHMYCMPIDIEFSAANKF